MTARILLVEDEPSIAEIVDFALTSEGFQVVWRTLVREAEAELAATPCDLTILDLGLPDGSGLELLKRLRRSSEMPVLILSARNAELDRVLGLELGADDYLTKPFSPRELLLRIKKILARSDAGEKTRDQLRFGDLLIDVPRHLASWKNKAFELTATEFKLLTTLAQRAGRVQSRDALLRDVWEYDSLIDTRTVDTHMRRLREKLGPAAKHLDTVRGVGYRFVE
jgi:DNA-binding response OmpR family regulator